MKKTKFGYKSATIMTASSAADHGSAPEVSIVMPCLNEADTLAICVNKALQALRDHDIRGEIIIADNGSIDGSRSIATALGVHLIDVTERGYGSALMAGIAAAGGEFVIMGDADNSYDFLAIPTFVEKLRQGYDLVQGCRLPSGGGVIMTGAMPFLHRWIGNPIFSLLARWWLSRPFMTFTAACAAFGKIFTSSLTSGVRGWNSRPR